MLIEDISCKSADTSLRSSKPSDFLKQCCGFAVLEKSKSEKIKKLGTMRVLILGGSGFISGCIARKALSQGNEVYIVSRGNKEIPVGVKSIVADRKVAGSLEAALSKEETNFDLVVDCIAYNPADAKQTLNLFSGKAGHIVFISTDFVFDPKKRNFPQCEENNCFLEDDSYGADKRRAELEYINNQLNFSNWTILRPCHVYGPGSLAGCLPMHGRDAKLLERIKNSEELELVGAGKFLQQPIFVEDLADLALSCHLSPAAQEQIYNCAGPDIIESVEYYQLIADFLSTELKVKELSVLDYLRDHPEHKSFLCHRIYNLQKFERDSLPVPRTSIQVGMQLFLQSLL